MVRNSIIDFQRSFAFILICFAIICITVKTSAGSLNGQYAGVDPIPAVKAQDDQMIKISFFNLELVTPSSGVQFYRDGILFLGLSKNYQKMVPSHVSFGTSEAYFAVPGDTSLQDPVVFSPGFSFSYPCDAVTFSNSYDKMYYTRKDKSGKYDRIYESDYSGGRDGKGTWSDASQPLDFCTGNFVYTHPALSHDGQMMVFASDREGASGGLDLFITRKTGDKWSVPENLGRLINSKSNELYPFLDNSDNLYFSSDGHPGYGGYDVFVSKYNGKRWEEPVNLTKLINSVDDDVAFTLSRLNGKTGFYSSIDNINKRYSQLYQINFVDNTAVKNPENMSDVLLARAMADTAFTYAKLLIAKADDIARAAEEAKTIESERAAKAAIAAKEAGSKQSVEAKRRADEEIRIVEETKAAEAKRRADEVKAAEARRIAEEKKAAEAVKAAEKLKAELAAKQPKAKVDTVKSITQVPEKLKDVVIYRVQFLSGATLRDMKELVVENKTYPLYIYFYLKEYRYTAGEFLTLEPARQLQFAIRRAGYPQAFVAAFKNNVRSLDVTLFR